MKFSLTRIAGASVFALSALGLSACGSSDSSDESPSQPATSVTLSGVVADGYLTGATVCLDMNRNKQCDTGEPTATTTTGGAYELPDIPTADSTAYPIAVEVVAGTIDADDPANPIASGYTLTAPAGKHQFVSPITTMIQTKIDTNPTLSADEAEGAVKTSMGYSVDSTVSLYTDYVAAKNDGSNPNAADYAQVHEVAKVTAQVLEDNQATLEAAAASAGLTTEEVLDSIVNIIVEQVLAELDSIAVDPTTYDTTTVDTAIATETTDITVAITDQELEESATVSNMQTVMTTGGGISWVWGWTDNTSWWEYEYGTVTVDGSGAFQETDYDWDTATPTWTLDTSVEDDYEIVMGATDWVYSVEDTASISFTFNADGTATYALGPDQVTFSASEVDVSGLLIADFVDDDVWLAGVDPAATFSTGAKVYQTTFTQDVNYYHVHFWQDDVDPAGNCPITYVDLTTNCTITWVNNVMGASTSLDAAFSTGLADTAWIWAGNVMHPTYGSVQGTLKLIRPTGTETSGVASYGFYDEVSAVPTFAHEELVTSTWSTVTLNGYTMVLVDIPLVARQASNNIDDETEKLMFVVQDGYLRNGEFTSAGFVSSEYMYGQTALTDLLANFTP